MKELDDWSDDFFQESRKDDDEKHDETWIERPIRKKRKRKRRIVRHERQKSVENHLIDSTISPKLIAHIDHLNYVDLLFLFANLTEKDRSIITDIDSYFLTHLPQRQIPSQLPLNQEQRSILKSLMTFYLKKNELIPFGIVAVLSQTPITGEQVKVDSELMHLEVNNEATNDNWIKLTQSLARHLLSSLLDSKVDHFILKRHTASRERMKILELHYSNFFKDSPQYFKPTLFPTISFEPSSKKKKKGNKEKTVKERLPFFHNRFAFQVDPNLSLNCVICLNDIEYGELYSMSGLPTKVTPIIKNGSLCWPYCSDQDIFVVESVAPPFAQIKSISTAHWNCTCALPNELSVENFIAYVIGRHPSTILGFDHLSPQLKRRFIAFTSNSSSRTAPPLYMHRKITQVKPSKIASISVNSLSPALPSSSFSILVFPDYLSIPDGWSLDSLASLLFSLGIHTISPEPTQYPLFFEWMKVSHTNIPPSEKIRRLQIPRGELCPHCILIDDNIDSDHINSPLLFDALKTSIDMKIPRLNVVQFIKLLHTWSV